MSNDLPQLTESEVRSVEGESSGFGALATERGNLPLKAVDVRAEITGLISQVTLEQTFVNAHSTPLEATYVFPLPDRAAVTRFTVKVADCEIEGVLKERGEARNDYDQAMQQGHRAAIAEEERPGTFTMRVGNLMPREEARVLLQMIAPLPYLDGEATFRFPLVVAPRYIPGAPLEGESVGDGTASDTDAVPDASRITLPVLLPGFPNPVRLSMCVDIDPAGLPVGKIRSSLHSIETVPEEGSRARRVTLQPGRRLDRDFILRFTVGEEAVRTALAVTSDAGGKTGTFTLTLVPPFGTANVPQPRDVVFLLDRSSSMSGWKMVTARRAMARMVDTLNDHDRFTIYAFDHVIELPVGFSQSLIPATDRNRFRAVESLAMVDSRGGTELREPLELAVEALSEGGNRQKIVVLVTDGQVGNEDQILRAVGKKIAGLRVFTVGIDQAVNDGFLKRLASLGGGCCELVESEDRLDEVMETIHRRLSTPVLTDIELAPSGLKIDAGSIVPARLAALFAGAPLVVSGRYQGNAKGSITIKARDAAGRPWTQEAEASMSANPAVAAVWARGRVRDLEDKFAAQGGGDENLEREIVRTSLEFGVLCRFTAFVAVDKSEVVAQGGEIHQVTQPVEAPSGWGALKEREPAPRPKRRSGILRSTGLRCGSSELRMIDAFVSAPTAAEVASYRKRAHDILESLRKSPSSSEDERLVALGTAMMQIEALIDDLYAIGAPESEVAQLEKLFEKLKRALGGSIPSTSAVADLWSKAEETLRAFAEGEAPPASPMIRDRSKSFWK